MMYDSWGDGWNGAELTINEVTYGLPSGAEGTEIIQICDPTTFATAAYENTGGNYASEVSWSVDCGDEGTFPATLADGDLAG
jgi:hypothetical protein